jgi:hypothetical protein
MSAVARSGTITAKHPTASLLLTDALALVDSSARVRPALEAILSDLEDHVGDQPRSQRVKALGRLVEQHDGDDVNAETVRNRSASIDTTCSAGKMCSKPAVWLSRSMVIAPWAISRKVPRSMHMLLPTGDLISDRRHPFVDERGRGSSHQISG